MSGPPKHRDRIGKDRIDRLLRELVHDPYKSKRKLREPSVCTGCGAVYGHGRWSWETSPADAQETMCPACHRIEDQVPAGFLTLSGEFLAQHREEIIGLIQNTEAREKAEHPMKRIMAFEDAAGQLQVTFTDPHLARNVGTAIAHAYGGELDYAYQKNEHQLRVTWAR